MNRMKGGLLLIEPTSQHTNNSAPQKPLRILHVVPSVDNEASGPSYSVVRLCEALIEQGQKVALVTLDGSNQSRTLPFLKTFPAGPGPRRLGISREMYRWMIREAEAGSFDIIHNHSLWMMPNIYPGWTARRSRVPYVVSPRGTLSEWAFRSGSGIKRLFWPLLQRPALGSVTAWHATSDSEYQDIRRIGFQQPVAIIPNGIDIPDPQPRKACPHRTLLFLGRIHRTKGLDLLLPAWKAVQDLFPNWKLRIVGPDNRGYLDKIKKMAFELDLRRVEFVGPLYGNAKWQAYSEAELFVLPTYSENFGVAVAEALACGTPAIVSQAAPWQGLQAQACGYWVKPGLESLKLILLQTLSMSQKELEEMGQRGRQWMIREFSFNRIGLMMLRTYQYILNSHDRPARTKL